MPRTLLILAAVWSQVFSLLGPAFVLCLSRDGGVCIEYAGTTCACCVHESGDAPDREAGCGCHHDETPSPRAGQPCDCQHIPLADRDREPVALTGRAAADQTLSLGVVIPLVGINLAPAVPAARNQHDPPGRCPASSAHLSQLAGIVLRC